MTATTHQRTIHHPAAPPQPSPSRMFLAVLRRDIFVTGRELPAFLAQVLVQPVFFLLVFVIVLGRSGFASPGYGSVLLPGLLALNAMFGALQAVALPLMFEFSWSREIEDRLLAPIPLPLLAVEKILFAALRGLAASLIMAPIGFLMIDVSWQPWGLLPGLLMLALGALLGATMGLVIGTAVQPRRIHVLFSMIYTPLLFTGAVQYPWSALNDLSWFHVVSALNPLTYVSEGVRACLAPQAPHIPFWLCALIVSVVSTLSALLGIRGFLRRALD